MVTKNTATLEQFLTERMVCTSTSMRTCDRSALLDVNVRGKDTDSALDRQRGRVLHDERVRVQRHTLA